MLSMSCHPSNEYERCSCSSFWANGQAYDVMASPCRPGLVGSCNIGDRSVHFGEDCPIITSSSLDMDLLKNDDPHVRAYISKIIKRGLSSGKHERKT